MIRDGVDGDAGAMAAREERVARNEAVFRHANDGIKERRDAIAPEMRLIPFLCECGNERCTEIVRLTSGQYTDVRSHPATFAVLKGHQMAGEVVTATFDTYEVVEKVDRAREIVEADYSEGP
jgi:hypothetical protein